jgi:hypothetical protein
MHGIADPIVPPVVIVNVIVTLGVNPLPDAVTVSPLGPWVGASVTAWILMVNDAVALSKLPSDPVTVTVYGVPDAVPEIVTVQLNIPATDTVAPHVPIVAPPPIDVEAVAPGVNPAPDTLTDTPVGP